MASAPCMRRTLACGTRLAFGSRRALHSIASLCAVASSPTLVVAHSHFSHQHKVLRRFSDTTKPPKNDALETLQDFICRLEEAEPHRKPHNVHETRRRRRSTLHELATSLSVQYRNLPPKSPERDSVLTFMARECGISEKQVAAAVEYYQQHNDGHHLTSLQHACTPRYERLFQLLLQQDAQDGIQFLVLLRQDLLQLIQSTENHDVVVHLKELDVHLRTILSTWFGPGMLEIRRITYEGTSASIVETIATKEAVHPLRSLDDLRARLGDDHRVFSAFSSLLPETPLVFCHVALRSTVSACMSNVLDTLHLEEAPKAAIFYSISSTQAGLSGVDLGQFLLKRAMALLQEEFPSLQTFVTLSPIPRFRKWLQEKIALNLEEGSTFVDETLLTDDDLYVLSDCLKCPSDQVLVNLKRALDNPSEFMEQHALRLEPMLMRLAARYLVEEKHHGKPLDGVARFHIANGAEMYQLNYSADMSRKGWHNSLGIMINYRYNLAEVEANQPRYEFDYEIPICQGVSKWL